MHIHLTSTTPLLDRLRAYSDYLDQRLERFENLLGEAKGKGDWASYDRLKTERAELSGLRLEFRRLFEREL